MSYSLSLGSYVFGSLTTLGQVDRYEFNVPVNGDYVISVQGADSGSGTLADPYLTFRAWNGLSYSFISSDNDSGTGRDALAVSWAYGDGWSAVDVSSYVSTRTGTYALWVALKDYVLMGATPGNDSNVCGTADNDIIDGLNGADTMKGGAGNDSYYVNQSGDVVIEAVGAGTDTVISQATHTLEANVEKLILTGSANLNGTGNSLANLISGNSGNNMLIGFAGNDSLSGGNGNDTLNGGTGNDSLSGGDGNDVYYMDATGDVIAADPYGVDKIFSTISCSLGSGLDNLTLTGTAAIDGTGNSLNNYISGNAAANHLWGNEGNDTLYGGVGADTMYGGMGNDIFYVDNARDSVSDSGGDTDKVYSSVTFTLASGIENITLTGSAVINATGNTAANILDGSANTAANILTGGAGNDTYLLGVGDSVVEAAGQGVDTVRAGFSYTLGATLENLVLTGTSAVKGTGNGVNNHLQGNAAANYLSGNDGNDTLNGGAGADKMYGGTGNDVFYVDNAADMVSDTGGTDKVYSSATFTLASGIENVTLTGSTAINTTGNTAANILDGSANMAANVLSGRIGNDTYILGVGDSVVEAAGEGLDTVLAGFNDTLGANQENLSLTGLDNIRGTGNSLNNVLRGNTGNNYLVGNDGNDTLIGGAGHDYLTGGNGNDAFVFTALADSDGNNMNYDSIEDFSAGDKIDLHGIDANTTLAGNQAFTYSTGPFTHLAGQLTIVFGSGVQGDVNGDGVADLYINCYTNQLGYVWSSADFIL